MNRLTERQKTILVAVVEDHIRSGEPVGSRSIAQNRSMGVSSATIRNELGVLEELGYLYQPHTSAGRVPTPLAYRHYVDSRSSSIGRSTSERDEVENFIEGLNSEFDDLLEKTSKLLSKLTHYVSLVMTPTYKLADLKRVDLVRLSDRDILIVLITNMGHVIKRNVFIESRISNGDLLRAESDLNRFLSGRSSSDHAIAVEDALKSVQGTYKDLIKILMDNVIDSLLVSDEHQIVFNGASNMVQDPSFIDRSKLDVILRYLEESNGLLQDISDIPQGIEVKIGLPTLEDRGADVSLVLGGYQRSGRNIGAIGLLGPQRMEYERAMSLVKISAATITKKLSRFS